MNVIMVTPTTLGNDTLGQIHLGCVVLGVVLIRTIVLLWRCPNIFQVITFRCFSYLYSWGPSCYTHGIIKYG